MSETTGIRQDDPSGTVKSLHACKLRNLEEMPESVEKIFHLWRLSNLAENEILEGTRARVEELLSGYNIDEEMPFLERFTGESEVAWGETIAPGDLFWEGGSGTIYIGKFYVDEGAPMFITKRTYAAPDTRKLNERVHEAVNNS